MSAGRPWPKSTWLLPWGLLCGISLLGLIAVRIAFRARTHATTSRRPRLDREGQGHAGVVTIKTQSQSYDD